MKRLLIILTALAGWTGLLIQLPITIANSRALGMSFPAAVLTYFSFFTILTNLLVATGLTFSLWPGTPAGAFFSRPTVTAALLVYIATVGITYSLLLRRVWNPEGLQKVADVLLHDAVPLLFVFCWIFALRKSHLRWKSVLPWLIYPLAYLAFALARGAFTGRYPYYFIDAGQLGYARTFFHSALLLSAFLVLCLVFVAISRRRSRIAEPL
jgi:hypothetical protein